MTEKEALKQIDVCVNFIKEYFKDNGTPNTKAVIGISGGKDSTIAAALLVRALGPDRVIGVMMPEYEQDDIKDSYKVCEILGIKHYVIDIGPACYELYDELRDVINGITDNKAVTTNTPARIRMATLYAIAAAVGGRVCNTGNASEAFIGYTTKYGDLAGDFALLKNLTVREIYAMGDAMPELPYKLVHKSPADGMSGKTDEDNTGIPYALIDAFLLEDIIPKDINVYEKMLVAHDRNLHKRCINLPAPYRVGRHLTQRGL